MAEKCARCRITESEVKLYDSIYDGRMASLCERCSIIENIPIIKKPSSDQLKNTDRPVAVYNRMKRMADMNGEKQDTFFMEDKLNALDKNPELELPEKEKLNLIPHYYWEIMKNRRRKGLSQEKLAEAIGESPTVIKMIEKGKLPENAKIVLSKLEQYFQTNFKLIPKKLPVVKQEPILLDKEGHALERIPEPKVRHRTQNVEIVSLDDEESKLDDLIEGSNEYVEEEIIIEDQGEKSGIFQKIKNVFKSDVDVDLENMEEMGTEEIINDEEGMEEIDIDKNALEIDIKQIDTSETTISDLRDVHRRKVQATKQEQLEEQKRIEERQRLIEARKEELRIRREKESKDLDNYLGGAELIGANSEKKDIYDYPDNVREFDEELV
jgi:ribosome-binding protein aMBF1 (putative translation factor)